MIKLPWVSRKKYDELYDYSNEMLLEKEDISTINFKLQDEICDLKKDLSYTKEMYQLASNEVKELTDIKEALENEINGLNSKISELDGKLLEVIYEKADITEKHLLLHEENDKHIKQIHDLKVVYNNMNNFCWCNNESKRQLIKLIQQLAETEKWNKSYILNYLEQITMRLGGGQKYNFDLSEEAEG